MEHAYGVYVKADGEGRVIAINSDAFLTDLTGWVKIDSGTSPAHRYAQSGYLPDGIWDERGVARYRLEGGALAARTQEEMDADAAGMVGAASQEERLAALEADARLLLEMTGDQEYRLCLMELGVSDSDL